MGKFVFRRGVADPVASTLTLTFQHVPDAGAATTYVDVLGFPDATPAQWEAIPPVVLDRLAEVLALLYGINYWKVHTDATIELADFALTRAQAEAWTTLYEKGLGEFFYRAQIDFRGLVAFPAHASAAPPPTACPRPPRALLAQGGGKDSIVSAMALARHGVPFDPFFVGWTRMQRRVSDALGRSTIRIRRLRDPSLKRRRAQTHGGYPSVALDMMTGVFAAALYGYSYVIFSNELSAESGNVEYLGLDVNHQWSKTIECEQLLRAYVADYITPDLVPFSLLHPYSEVFIVRELTRYPQFFPLFSSCNRNFYLPLDDPRSRSGAPAYWCNQCAKCAFIFACLSAFLPRAQVMQIVGSDPYSDPRLVPMYRRLLGIASTKPFDCVGTPAETTVAMARARAGGEYARTPVMAMFEELLADHRPDLPALEATVLVPTGPDTTPAEFRRRFLPGPLFA